MTEIGCVNLELGLLRDFDLCGRFKKLRYIITSLRCEESKLNYHITSQRCLTVRPAKGE